MNPEEVLYKIADYLRTEVTPNANFIDHNPSALRQALKGLCDLGVMALRRPQEYGGPQFNERDFRSFQELIARSSGSLAFLQTQHQSAVSMIAKSENAALKSDFLPRMHSADCLVGIGFSQLRRPGPPMVTATETAGGYLINGLVPWVTGYSFFPKFMIGAELPDGRALFGIVPFEESEEIQIGEPMQLSAMESALTTIAEFNDHFLPDAFVADIKPAGWIFKNDQINITLQGFFALGCAMGSIDVIRAQAERKDPEFLNSIADKLQTEIGDCRQSLSEAQELSGEETTDAKLQLRAWAIDLSMRCAHAAVAAAGGSANTLDHPAQRLLRESLVYTVSAQTKPIMHATLERLANR